MEERKEIPAKAAKEGRKFTKVEQKRLDELYSEKIEQYLDTGYGACYFQQDKIAGKL